MLRATCEAVVARAGDLSIECIPVPQPGSHQLLVKVEYAAQNPTDVQAFDSNVFGDGTVLGCDFAGTVVQIGADVRGFALGDYIAGLIWGGEIKGLGAYSQYTLADDRICFKVPMDHIGPAHAATIPLASATSWLALFSKDCLHIDRSKASGESVLIWGGSSSVGLYAMQIAAMYGLNVVTTCSPRNFRLARLNGADHVFDYHDEDVVEKIKEVAPKLKYVFDTIGNPTSSATASKAATGDGAALCTVRPGKAHTENVPRNVKVTDVLVWTAFLKEHRYGDFYWPPKKEDHELAIELFDKLPDWIVEGKIKPNPPRIYDGLDSVPKGFQAHRDGRISGWKVVYAL